MKNFCGEIQYETDQGNVHSDICFHDHDGKELTEDQKHFFRKCLDEWLEKSNGTGIFWVGNWPEEQE